jgi:hypothetical protein
VTVEALPQEGKTQVEVVAREWEGDARKFLAGL